MENNKNRALVKDVKIAAVIDEVCNLGVQLQGVGFGN